MNCVYSSKTKTQVMRLNCKNADPIKIQSGDTIKEIKDFTNLGAVVSTEKVVIKIYREQVEKGQGSIQKAKENMGLEAVQLEGQHQAI